VERKKLQDNFRLYAFPPIAKNAMDGALFHLLQADEVVGD
jgi:hypothetical protein